MDPENSRSTPLEPLQTPSIDAALAWVGRRAKRGLDAVGRFLDRRTQETLAYAFPYPGMTKQQSALVAKDIPEYHISLPETEPGNEATYAIELGWRGINDPSITEQDIPGIDMARALTPNAWKNPGFMKNDMAMRRLGMEMAGSFSWLDLVDPDAIGLVGGSMHFITSPMRNKWHPRNISTWYRNLWRPSDAGRAFSIGGTNAIRQNTLSRALRNIFLHHEAGPYSLNPNSSFFQMDALTSDLWLADMLNTHADGLYGLYRGRTAIREAVGDVPSASKSRLFAVDPKKLRNDPARFQLETYFNKLMSPIAEDDELDGIWQGRVDDLIHEYFGALADHPSLRRPYQRPRVGGGEYTPNTTSRMPSEYVTRSGSGYNRTAYDVEKIRAKVAKYRTAVDRYGEDFVNNVLTTPKEYRTQAWYEKVQENSEWGARLSEIEGKEPDFEVVARANRDDFVTVDTHDALGIIRLQTEAAEQGTAKVPYKSKVLRSIMTNEVDELPLIPKPKEWLHYTTGNPVVPASSQGFDELMTEFLRLAIDRGVIGDHYLMAELAQSDPRYADLFLNPGNNDGSMLLAYLMRADTEFLRKLEILRADTMARKGYVHEPKLLGRYPLILFPDGTTGGFPIRYNFKYRADNPDDLPFTFPTGGLPGENVQTELNRLHEVISWSEGSLGVSPNEILGAKKASHMAHLIDRELTNNRRLLQFEGGKPGVIYRANEGSHIAYDFRIGRVYEYLRPFNNASAQFRSMISSVVKHDQSILQDLEPYIQEYFNTAYSIYAREHLLDTGKIIGYASSDAFHTRVNDISVHQIEQILQRMRTKNLSEPIAASQMEMPATRLFAEMGNHDPSWVYNNERTFFELLEREIDKAPKAKLINEDRVLSTARQAAIALAGSSNKPTRELLDAGAIITITSPHIDAQTQPVWGFAIQGLNPEGAGRINKAMQDLNARALIPTRVMTEEVDASTFVGRARDARTFLVDYGIQDLFILPRDHSINVTEDLGEFLEANRIHFDSEIETVIQQAETDVLKNTIVNDPSGLKMMPSEHFQSYMKALEKDPNTPSMAAIHTAQSGLVPTGGFIIDLGTPSSAGGWTASEVMDRYAKQVRKALLAMPRQMLAHYEVLNIPDAIRSGDHIDALIDAGVHIMRDVMPYHEVAVYQDSVARTVLDHGIRRLIEASDLKRAGKIDPSEVDRIAKEVAQDFDDARLHMEGAYLNHVQIKAQENTVARTMELVEEAQKASGAATVTKQQTVMLIDSIEQEAFTRVENALTDIDDAVRKFIEHPDNTQAWKPQMQEGTAEKIAAETGKPMDVTLKAETQQAARMMTGMCREALKESPSLFLKFEDLESLPNNIDELQMLIKKLPRWNGMSISEKALLRERITTLYDTVRGQTQQIQLSVYKHHLRSLRKLSGGSPTGAKQFMARKIAGRSSIVSTPVMVAVAKQYFTENADEEQINEGRNKLAALHALDRITTEEYEAGLRYSDNYKLMETSDIDPVEAYRETWQDLDDPAKRLLQITARDRYNPLVADVLVPMLDDEQFAKRYLDYVLEMSHNDTRLASWRIFHNLGIPPTATVEILAGHKPSSYDEFLDYLSVRLRAELQRSE